MRWLERVFLWRVLVDLPRALDLVDRDGNPDHGKLVPFLTVMLAWVAHFLGNPMPLWHLIVLVSAAFGYGSWRTFLHAKLVTRQDMVQHTTTVVREERDPLERIDPAP